MRTGSIARLGHGALLLLACACACSSARSRSPSSSVAAADAAPTALTADAAPALAAEIAPTAVPSVFSVIAEGSCDGLDVSFLENHTFVHYGFVQAPGAAGAALVLAHALDEGGVSEDVNLGKGIRGLRSSAYDMTTPMAVEKMTGMWPDTATLTVFADLDERGHPRQTLHWKGEHWQADPPTELSQDRVSPWRNGATLTLVVAGSYPQFSVSPRGSAETPDFGSLHVKKATDCAFDPSDLVVRASGELFLAGAFCGIFPDHGGYITTGEAAIARWVPGERAKLEAIPDVPRHADLTLTELSESAREGEAPRLLAFGRVTRAGAKDGADPYLAELEGRTWSRVTVPYEGFVTAGDHDNDADGTLWVHAGGALYARNEAQIWEKQPLEKVTAVGWHNHRPAWAVAGNAVYRRADSGAWSVVPVPKPAFAHDADFAITGIRVSPRGEAWLTARTSTTAPSKTFAVLRFGAPTTRAASRCEASTHPGKSFRAAAN